MMLLDLSILLRLQADNKQKSENFWCKILRLAYRLYISVQISMPRSRCKDAVYQDCFSLRAKDYENGISLQMVLNE